MSKDKPTITALMVTMGRYDLVKQSYDFFYRQDYPKKKLLVVTDCSDEAHEALKSLARDKNVTVLHTDAKKTLGELRNLSLEYSPSDLTIQWDDDDWYAPNRISLQYDAFKQGAVLLTEQLHYFRDTNSVGWTVDKTGIEGTILYDRRYKYRYPSQGKGEDSVLKKELAEAGLLTLTGGGICYCRTYHGGNTWDKGHHVERVKKFGKSKSQLDGLKAQLEKAASIYKWPKGWKAISS